MARNSPPVPRPRRAARRVREKTAAAPPDAGPAVTDTPAAPLPEDLRTVHGWLTRLSTDPAEIERLLTDIVRRSRTGSPAWLRDAPDLTRLQFLTVSAVLRLRGVL